MKFTPEEIAAIIEETVEETTKDVDLIMMVFQQIAHMFKQNGTRDFNSNLEHPLLMMLNQIYTNTLLLEDIQRKIKAMEQTKRVER